MNERSNRLSLDELEGQLMQAGEEPKQDDTPRVAEHPPWTPDRTDDIMNRVSPVMKATVSKLEKIIEKCQGLIEQVNTHESHIRSICMERDQRTRAVLEKAAMFAHSVEDECHKANIAIDTLADTYALEPFDNAAMKIRIGESGRG